MRDAATVLDVVRDRGRRGLPLERLYRRAAVSTAGPGGHPGNDSVASAAGLHPADRLFGQATPGPAPSLRPQPGPSKGARPGRSPRTRRPAPASA